MCTIFCYCTIKIHFNGIQLSQVSFRFDFHLKWNHFSSEMEKYTFKSSFDVSFCAVLIYDTKKKLEEQSDSWCGLEGNQFLSYNQFLRFETVTKLCNYPVTQI